MRLTPFTVMFIITMTLMTFISFNEGDTLPGYIPQFQCPTFMESHQFLPITLRFPVQTGTPLNSANEIPILTNTWKLAKFIAENEGIKVQFAIGPSLPELNGHMICGAEFTPIDDSPKSYGFELQFCRSGLATVTDKYRGRTMVSPVYPVQQFSILEHLGWCYPHNPGTNWGSNESLRSDYLFLNILSDAQLAQYSVAIMRQLSIYFDCLSPHSHPWRSQCLPTYTDVGLGAGLTQNVQCGDGFIVGGTAKPLACSKPYLFSSKSYDYIVNSGSQIATSKPYYPNMNADDLAWFTAGCTDTCQLAPTARRTYIRRSSAPLAPDDQSDGSTCSTTECGTNNKIFDSFYSEAIMAKDPKTGLYPLTNPPNLNFAFIGYPPPTVYNILHYFLGDVCDNTASAACQNPTWLCRKTTERASNGQTNWVPCNSYGDEYILRNPYTNEASPPLSDLYPEFTKSPAKYICGPKGLVREVRCAKWVEVSTGSTLRFYEDTSCLTLRPYDIIRSSNIASYRSCDQWGFADVYTGSTEIPDPKYFKPSATEVSIAAGPRVSFNPPSCTIDDPRTGLPRHNPAVAEANQHCFRGCDAEHTRYLQCMAFVQPDTSILGFPDNTPPPEVLPKSMCSAYNFPTIYKSSESANANRCFTTVMCNTAFDSEFYDCRAPTCQCGIDTIEPIQQCTTLDKYAQDSKPVGIARSYCPGAISTPPINCKSINQWDECYTTWVKEGNNPPQDPSTIVDTAENCVAGKRPSSFTTVCVGRDGVEVSDPDHYRCDSSWRELALTCKETVIRPVCSLEFIDLPDDAWTHGLRNVASLKGCQFKDELNWFSPNGWCGVLKFHVQKTGCEINRGNDDWTPASSELELQRCAEIDFEGEFSVNFSSFCRLECYDWSTYNHVTKTGTPLPGDCTKEIDQSAIQCGETNDNEICVVKKRKWFSKCLHTGPRIPGQEAQHLACRNPLEVPSYDEVASGHGEKGEEKCFMVDKRLSFSLPLTPDAFTSLRLATVPFPRCQFKPRCRYHYTNPGLEFDHFPLTSAITWINASTFSPTNCHNSFQCSQDGVCGSVERDHSCALYSSNYMIAHPDDDDDDDDNTSPFTMQSTNPLDLFQQYEDLVLNRLRAQMAPEEEEDIYVLNELDTLSTTFSSPQSSVIDPEIDPIPPQFTPQLDLHALTAHFTEVDFQMAVTQARNANAMLKEMFEPFKNSPLSCGKLTAKPGCSDDEASNCYLSHCYIPNTFAGEDQSDIVPVHVSSFQTDKCSELEVQKHCQKDIADDKCGPQNVYLHYYCIDRRTQLPVDNSRCENYIPERHIEETPATPGLNDSSGEEFLHGVSYRQCRAYQGCTFGSTDCFWMNANKGRIVPLVPPLAHTDPNPELCGRYVEQEEEICEEVDLCGDAFLASTCTVHTPDGVTPRRSYKLTKDECLALNNSNYIDYSTIDKTQTCFNHRLCSGWSCSAPSSKESLPSDDEIRNVIRTDLVTQYFDQNNGVINQLRCRDPLVHPNTESICGLSQVERRVGCLTTFTSDFFNIPSYVWDSQATECGDYKDPGFTIPPHINSPVFTYGGCKSSLTCTSTNTPFNSENCAAITCPLVPQPDVDENSTLPTHFEYSPGYKCTSFNGTQVPLRNCGFKDQYATTASLEPSMSCPYFSKSNFCQSNLQIPLGFDINAAVTDVNGKYIPGSFGLTSTQQTKPAIELQFKLNGSCQLPSRFGLTHIYVGNTPVNRNVTVTHGQVLPISFTLAYYDQTSYSVSLYLVPVTTPEPNIYNNPYFITALAPTTSQYHNVVVPDWIPADHTYVIVLYSNILTFDWVSDVYVEVLARGSSIPTNGDGINSSEVSPPLEQDIITPASVFTTQTTISSPSIKRCRGGQLCYSGECIGSTSIQTCRCNPGYSGSHCAQPTTCDVSKVSQSVCNTNNGVMGPTSLQTQYSPISATTDICNTCNCLGSWSQLDGCNTCLLICGAGTPNESCDSCTCPPGYSGKQCECYSKNFALSFRRPPPFIQRMFIDTTAPYTANNLWEGGQLQSWKNTLVNDISSDLNQPTDRVEVISWGSTVDSFVVEMGLTLCAAYEPVYSPVSPNENLDQINWSQQVAQINEVHKDKLRKLWESSSQMFENLQKQIQASSPFANLPPEVDLDTELLYFRPTFDHDNIVPRIKAANRIVSGSIRTEDSPLEITNQNHPDLDNNDAMFSALSVNPDASQRFQFTHPAISQSPTSDSSAGFLSLSPLYDPIVCGTEGSDSTNPDCTYSLPTLTPTTPKPKERPPEPWNKNWIVLIVLAIVFVGLTVAAILVCYAVKTQKWCFKDWKKNRRDRKRKKRSNRAKSRTHGDEVERTVMDSKGPQHPGAQFPIDSSISPPQ